jgi:hypothetical protein
VLAAVLRKLGARRAESGFLPVQCEAVSLGIEIAAIE